MDASVKGNMSESIFALEDSKDLFEAIGGMNDDQDFGNNGGLPKPDNTEYGVDDMLTIIPGSTDPYAQSVTAKQEPTAEQKRFVLDKFAEQMEKNHLNEVNKEAIDTLSPIVQDMAGSSINVNQFLNDLQDQAFQRISAQNVSEAQPGGAVPEDDGLAGQGDVGAQQPGAMAPATDPTALGPGAQEAPGGIPTEPSLDANVGDPNAMGGADDLGLGGITDDTGSAGLDSFGAEPGAPEGGELGLDGIGAEGGEGGDLGLDGIGGEGESAPVEGSEGGELGLDGIGAEGGEGGEGGDLGLDGIGGEGEGASAEGGEGGSAEGGAGGKDDDILGGSNLDNMSDDAFGGDDTNNKSDEKGPSTSDNDDDSAFEAEMTQKMPILESLREKYMDDVAKERASAALCEFVQRRQMEKKAQLEAKSKAFAAEQVKFEAAAATMRNELGSKVGSLIAEESNKRAESILESASRAYANAQKRKADAMMVHPKPAHVESAAIPDSLKAQLESISKDYHATVARENSAKAEAARAAAPAPKLESQQVAPKAAPKATTAKPKTMLESQLAGILARH